MQVSLLLPPLTQLNAPYPSTAYLARFLRKQGIEVYLRDLGLEFALKLFSEAGLAEVFDALEGQEDLPREAWSFLSLRSQHQRIIGPVIRFLQGQDRTLAPRILNTPLLPKGPRLLKADLSGFGGASVEDSARHLATLYLEDLADLVTACLDPGFGLARYQHHLGLSGVPFPALMERLTQCTVLDRWLDTLASTVSGEVVGLSVPFPGTLYGALRIGQRLKEHGKYVVFGGGYINTELRWLMKRPEPRLWAYVDAVCFDDGEGPLGALLEWKAGGKDHRHRTVTSDGVHQEPHADIRAESAGWYADLPLSHYLSLVDGTNPAHRLWSDGRWSRITLAHGCYWKKCSFCDIQLDYIAGYSPNPIIALVDQMEELIAETGQRGFHLADEAAPPKAMRELALELLRRKLVISWWGNIRFDPYFTPDLCRLLAASGLVAVTGGLEVASDRLLKLMNKGVTVGQVARVGKAFREAGILVHAYLMYGFPTQTDQETVDSLEVVRQLFKEDVISSGFWHRFVLTRHSGVYPHPERFGVQVMEAWEAFGENDLEHLDPLGGNHDRFDTLLPLALKSWMKGQELDRKIWGVGLPETTVVESFIREELKQGLPLRGKRWVWLGGEPLMEDGRLVLYGRGGERVVLKGEARVLEWAASVVCAAGREEVEVIEGGERVWERLRKVGMVLV